MIIMQNQVLCQIHQHLPESFVFRRQKIRWQFPANRDSRIAFCTICSFRPQNMLFVLIKKKVSHKFLQIQYFNMLNELLKEHKYTRITEKQFSILRYRHCGRLYNILSTADY